MSVLGSSKNDRDKIKKASPGTWLQSPFSGLTDGADKNFEGKELLQLSLRKQSLSISPMDFGFLP